MTLDATQTVTIASSAVNPWNNASSLTVAGPGSLTVRGAIEGLGDLAISAGGNLMVNNVVQNALVIGGTAGSHGLVTIDASDASGNSLSALAAGTPTKLDKQFPATGCTDGDRSGDCRARVNGLES